MFLWTEKSQTVENENRQHELSIAIVKMDLFFFLFCCLTKH